MVEGLCSSESSRWPALPPTTFYRPSSQEEYSGGNSKTKVISRSSRHRHPLGVSSEFKFHRRKLPVKAANIECSIPTGEEATLVKTVYTSGNAKLNGESTSKDPDTTYSDNQAKVKFGSNSVQDHDSSSTWSDREVFDSWYTSEEYEDICNAVEELRYVLHSCSVAEAEAHGHCIRGIEYCISESSRERRQEVIRAAKNTVFSIQEQFDRLRECEEELLKDSARAQNYESDDEYEFYTKEDEALTIASAYASVSGESSEHAHRMGLYDERVGKAQWKQDAIPRPASRKFSAV